jgi:hypothetical protein
MVLTLPSNQQYFKFVYMTTLFNCKILQKQLNHIFIFKRDLHTNTTTNTIKKNFKKHIQSYVEIHEIF